MTKAFLHGRTEAIRTVQPESIHFVKVCLALPKAPCLSHKLHGLLKCAVSHV